VGDQRYVNAVLDQHLGGAAVQRVDALDHAGLDGPLPGQALVELGERPVVAEVIPLVGPHRGQRR
jgi:hypothetical protein